MQPPQNTPHRSFLRWTIYGIARNGSELPDQERVTALAWHSRRESLIRNFRRTIGPLQTFAALKITKGFSMPASRLSLSADTPIFEFSTSDNWTVQDSLEGTQIFGANGSGKTSGSGAALASRMLALGYGGLILTVKNDERDLWADPQTGYCARAGRLADLIVLSKGGPHQFDFLEYELQRSGAGAGDTGELASVVRHI